MPASWLSARRRSARRARRAPATASPARGTARSCRWRPPSRRRRSPTTSIILPHRTAGPLPYRSSAVTSATSIVAPADRDRDELGEGVEGERAVEQRRRSVVVDRRSTGTAASPPATNAVGAVSHADLRRPRRRQRAEHEQQPARPTRGAMIGPDVPPLDGRPFVRELLGEHHQPSPSARSGGSGAGSVSTTSGSRRSRTRRPARRARSAATNDRLDAIEQRLRVDPR